jgi:hypothetical protein
MTRFCERWQSVIVKIFIIAEIPESLEILDDFRGVANRFVINHTEM